MRTSLSLLLLTTAAALNGACSGGSTAAIPPWNSPAGQLDGSYRYLAYDSANVLLLEGELLVSRVDDSTLTGTWVIAWAAGADTSRPVGPQVGTGTLDGSPAGDRWHLTLTPGWADNNVDLVAATRESNLEGTWVHTTFAGPRSGGRFQALRQ